MSRAKSLGVDGTFKICPHLWHQVMIICAEVSKKFFVPVAFGFLPDNNDSQFSKNITSTQLFKSSQLSVESKLVKKTRTKNKRELSYLDNSCILPDSKRTRNKKTLH